MSENEIVVADIGGTHARFAVARVAGGKVQSLGTSTTLANADYATFADAWTAFTDTLGGPVLRAASIAIAAPVRGSRIKLTNNDWVFAPAELAGELGLESARLLNDFEAVAYAVAAADAQDMPLLCGPDEPLPREGAISVIGPGTGLGVALLVRGNGRDRVLATEGGHIAFAPVDEFEDRVLQRLRGRFDRVSAERVVAGSGLRPIWAVLAQDEGAAPPPDGPDKDLWVQALSGDDPIAVRAVERFCLSLGSVVGDIALAHGPGPVVLAGGLGARLRKTIKRSGFARRFVQKGRYRAMMEQVPVRLLALDEPGLLGAAMAHAQEMDV